MHLTSALGICSTVPQKRKKNRKEKDDTFPLAEKKKKKKKRTNMTTCNMLKTSLVPSKF